MKKITLSMAMVWLSKKKDREELMDSLLNITSQILHADQIKIFDLFSKTGDREFSSHNIENVLYCDATGRVQGSFPIHENEKMLKCISHKKAVVAIYKNDDKEELFYPVRNKSGVIQILHVQSNECFNREALHSLVMLLSVYRDLLLLLLKSEIDFLTGLKNRYCFSRDLNKQILLKAVGQNDDNQFLAVMDIDHFKRINDEFGHVVGDEVLMNFARIVNGHFFGDGLSYRYGGEEFSVIFSEHNVEKALHKLNIFRQAVLDYKFPNVGNVSVSIGLTHINAMDISLEAVERADRALYYGKANGRNQVHVYEILLENGLVDPMVQESDAVIWR